MGETTANPATTDTAVSPETRVQIETQRLVVDPTAPPLAVDYLGWVRVAEALILEVGHVDPIVARKAVQETKAGGKASPIPMFIINRFQFNGEAVLRVLEAFNEIRKSFEKDDQEDP
jgi:hypothetical protein